MNELEEVFVSRETACAVIHLLRRQSNNPIRKPATAAALRSLAAHLERKMADETANMGEVARGRETENVQVKQGAACRNRTDDLFMYE